MQIESYLENLGSIQYWSKRALSLTKKTQISPPLTQTSSEVFCIKINLCIILIKGGKIRKPDAVLVMDLAITKNSQVEHCLCPKCGMIYRPDMYNVQARKKHLKIK